MKQLTSFYDIFLNPCRRWLVRHLKLLIVITTYCRDHLVMLALYLFGPVKAEDHYKGTVYVYEVPVRIWHWVNAIAILVLCVTGWFIGNPPPSMQLGEATQQFAFGYIRFTHFAAAMIMTIGFGGRVYWAFKGNHHARQLFILPLLDKNWWSEVLFEIRWYLFLEKEPKKYVGHNPLAQASMFTFVTLGMIFMISTGFALYAEALGSDHWLSVLFSPVKYFVNNSQLLRTIHSLGMWIIIIFSMIHIYLAIREDIMSRQTIVSSMISGYRTFKDDRP